MASPAAEKSPVVRIEVTPRTLLLGAGLVIGAWLLVSLLPVVLTLLVALIFAGTLDPAVQWLERHHIRRLVALLIVFGTAAIVVVTLALLILPALAQQLVEYATQLPALQAKIAEKLGQVRLLNSAAESVKTFDPKNLLASVGMSKLVAVSGGVLEFLGYLASSLVLALYLVADRERVRGAVYAVVPRAHHVRLAHILSRLEVIVGGYMRGQLITSVAIFVFAWVLLTICRVPGGLALAAFAGLTDVIPFVGGLLATAPAVLAGLSVSTWVGVAVLVAMVAYQEFESRIIVPAVYGRTLRLPAVVVIIALLVGGKLLGIIGALLSLPVAAALLMMLEELRVELPGEAGDGQLVREHDEQAQREYEQKTEGVPAEAAAKQTSATEPPPESPGTKR